MVSAGVLEEVLVACRDPSDPTARTTIDLRTEIGALNYAYALLQLETDFFARVMGGIYAGVTSSELSTLTQFANATKAARDDMRVNQISSGRITEGLLFRTGQLLDFADRTSVLTHARTIEETSAEAMQALSGRITTPDKQTLVSNLAAQALTRANTIDGWLGVTFTPVTIDLAAAMVTLAPYYQTTLTILGG
jgi:hypothetical protein